MIRITLEEATWEAYNEIGEELLEHLKVQERDFVQRYFGVFPYQPHTYRQLALVAGISLTTAHSRLRDSLKELKRIIILQYNR